MDERTGGGEKEEEVDESTLLIQYSSVDKRANNVYKMDERRKLAREEGGGEGYSRERT